MTEEDEKPEWKPATQECQCGDGEQLEYRVVESSCGGYEDYQYRCKACGKTFWVDGVDS